ncbi:hypothetical protein LCGC14_1507490 [marine sediment metagenome]|uniref:Uncharacterized protein n=1 Tax=marine sediment metagenome TaxID=412755 RepID=A0A0F9M3P3_9ZZZZ
MLRELIQLLREAIRFKDPEMVLVAIENLAAGLSKD